MITLNYLCFQPENQYFERKGVNGKDTIKPTKLADELIGMLNADGGILAFGVSDQGEIQDLNTIKDKLDDYRKVVFDLISPPCQIELEEIYIDNKLIFLFHIEQDLERIYFRKDTEKVFLRVADSNRELNREQIKKLEYDKNIRLFEDEVVENFDLADLDLPLLESYKQKINYKNDELSLLYTKHLLHKKDDNFLFKKSAVLLFAIDPEKYIPSASVRYVRYDGTYATTGENHNVVKDQRFENNIPRLIDQLKQFLQITLRDYYFLDIDEGKFKKIPEYPQEAWLEGVVNALCHRSYNVQGNVIYIKHFDDRLEISNSGPLPAQVTVENIRTERFSRNPRLARILEDLGYVRQLNEGVDRIYESMEKSMLSEPEYKEVNGNVYLTLRNRVSSHDKAISIQLMERIEKEWKQYNPTQQKILTYLFARGALTVSELAKLIHIHHNTVRSYLTTFVEIGIIERHSDKKRDLNAKYTVKKE